MDKFINKFMPIFLFFVLMGMTGCEGFTPISPIEESASQSVKSFGSCDRKSVNLFNLCSEVNGSDYDDADYLEVLQTNCETTGGSYSTLNCDPTDSVGTCVVGKGQSNEVHTTYYPPLYSAASAQVDCASNGGKFKSK